MVTQQLPLVSVCIPVFNGEKYILECINSVLEQSYTNFELLILDNCSTDSTFTIIEKIGDSRISYVKNENNFIDVLSAKIDHIFYVFKETEKCLKKF